MIHESQEIANTIRTVAAIALAERSPVRTVQYVANEFRQALEWASEGFVSPVCFLNAKTVRFLDKDIGLVRWKHNMTVADAQHMEWLDLWGLPKVYGGVELRVPTEYCVVDGGRRLAKSPGTAFVVGRAEWERALMELPERLDVAVIVGLDEVLAAMPFVNPSDVGVESRPWDVDAYGPGSAGKKRK